MSDDETRPLDPEAPTPPPTRQPAYAMPLPVGYPAYVVPQRPRFADQVMGMRAVVATALACLIVGGLSGFALGHATGNDDRGFIRGPGMVNQRGAFPNGQNGFPTQPFGQGQSQNGR